MSKKKIDIKTAKRNAVSFVGERVLHKCIYGVPTYNAINFDQQVSKLYWDIGKAIVDRQRQAQWQSGSIDRLIYELKGAFPNNNKFSKDQVFYIRAFYLAYEKFSQAVMDQKAMQPHRGTCHIFSYQESRDNHS